MIDLVKAAQLMLCERQCVLCSDNCGHDCGKCELAQDSSELIEAYELAHWALTTMQDLADILDFSIPDERWNG